ncbi:MAG TPA: hypothetical protein PLN21_04775 [Gemmatales bacterium]|nr:hypothetical protein [Gemmatales bacterium]
MKAEERHRLQENDLVKGLNQVTTGIKRPSNMILLMIGLVVVLGVVYWYWSGTAASRVSRAWTQYYEKRNSLEDLSVSAKSGPAGQAIQLGIADKSFDQGFNLLFINPQSALKEFEQAAKQYEDVSVIASNSDIQLRALIGAARANENLGELTRAVGFYDKVIEKFAGSNEWKDHPLVKDSKERKTKLTSADSGLAQLYQSWAAKLKQVTTTPGIQTPPPFLNVPTPPIPDK